MNRTARITIRITAQTREQLADIAGKSRRSVSEVARQTIELALQDGASRLEVRAALNMLQRP